MRNLVFLAFLALLVFAVAGWYLNWYSVAGTPTASGRTKIEIEVDGKKIREDTGKFIDKSKAKIHDSMEKTKENEAAAKEPVKPTAPKINETPTKPPKAPV